MAGPLTDTHIINPAANTLYAGAFLSDLILNGGSATWETRSFSAAGVQTVYGGLQAGVHDWSTGANSLGSMLSGVYGVQWTSSLGNNNSDNLGPYGAASVTYSGGNYLSLRCYSYGSGHPFCTVNIRRSGGWTNIASAQAAVWVRRSGVWVRRDTQGQTGWVRRSGAWRQAWYNRWADLERETWVLQFDPDGGIARMEGLAGPPAHQQEEPRIFGIRGGSLLP